MAALDARFAKIDQQLAAIKSGRTSRATRMPTARGYTIACPPIPTGLRRAMEAGEKHPKSRGLPMFTGGCGFQPF